MKNNRITIASLLVAMLILSMAFVPSVSAETINEETDVDVLASSQIELTPEPEPTIVSSPTAEENPYWIILELDKEGQKIILNYIDNSYVSAKEKRDMKKAMKDIWNRYPDQIVEEDNIVLEAVFNAVMEYYADAYGQNDDIGIEWYGGVHQRMAYLAVKKWGISDTYANVARDYAAVPDDWDDGFWQSYNHYWNPDTDNGWGPYNCAVFAGYASDYYDNSQFTNAYQNLGYSTHYMADLGNPMHTGKESEQINNPTLHYKYEAYVRDNWDSGYNFEDTYSSATTYYVITSPEQSAKNLATYSHADLNSLYQYVLIFPDTFGDKSYVISTTDDLVYKTAKYNIGLVDYMRR